jgi:TetR/AcrR family transcriptional repressor of nem operon
VEQIQRSHPEADRERAARAGAVQKAMELFWARGAESVSYNDIVEATGLSRKALYGLWPDKGSLVHDALRHYRSTILDGMLASLRQPGRGGLETFWRGMEIGVLRRGWCGCFLFRSASGPLRNDPFVAAAYEDYAGALRRAIGANIAQGQAGGEISAAISPEDAAWKILALNGLISMTGARSGYGAGIAALIRIARVECGLTA